MWNRAFTSRSPLWTSVSSVVKSGESFFSGQATANVGKKSALKSVSVYR